MRLWRLSSVRHAGDLDGGFGLFNDGRWNTRGRAVTYCSTVASLPALEKRVHVNDPALLPPQVLVTYDVPDSMNRRIVEFDDLPPDWTKLETYTQSFGDRWLDSKAGVLLVVPSVIMPFADIPDRNVLINHAAADADLISIANTVPFFFDPRLFVP
jgi:RES domain-containing protein